MHRMFNHFKTLNESSTLYRNDNLYDNVLNEVENPELDDSFTKGEIRNVIKSLKCFHVIEPVEEILC